MQARAYDFRDEVPLWVRYAEYIGNGSDKYYEIRIDMADDGAFVITRRWGARPDIGKGQVKTEVRHNVTQAQGVAQTYLSAKVAKGYVQCERPLSADFQVERERTEDDY